MYELIYKIDNQQGTSDSDPEPRQHYEVHCNQCGWWGYKKNLHSELGCPMCSSDQQLEYKDNS